MKLGEIYKLGINFGIRNDFRGEAAVKKQLQRTRKEYESLRESEREFFDTDLLENPYPDTRLNTGDPGREIKKALAGIDADSGEALLADRLGVDLLISHHPQGKSFAELDEQMHLQTALLHQIGIPINIAEGLMESRIGEVERRVHPVNHYQTVDAAKLLNMAMLTTHTICDNAAAMFVQKLMDKQKPETLGEILELLMDVPEYRIGRKNGAGPTLFTGGRHNSAGKIVVTEFTGGTEGSKVVYERLAHAGIGTVLSMHASEEHRKEAERNHINLVIAGHMSSDSLGMNLFLDELEKRGVEIIAAAGLIRVSRNKPASRTSRPAATRKPQRATSQPRSRRK